MKQILIILVIMATGIAGFSQIKVSKYEIAFKVDANDVPEPDVTFTSECGEVNVKITERMASGGCIGNLVRTYTAIDDCGNEATAEQYLSLQDNQGPELYGVPDDIYVDAKNIPELPVVGAKDLGDELIEVKISEERKDDLVIRTFTATDKCGNTSTKTYTIYVGKGR
ncbi:MAG: hypothetical protein AB8B53_10590 [Flavobacteriales bacterium]